MVRHCGNQYGTPQKLNIGLPWDPEIQILGKYLKELKARPGTNIHIPMFTAALFTVARKQPKCPLTDEWIIKTRYAHTVEFYPALERKEILTHPSTWRKPENIMLSEISQTQNDKYCMTPLT